MRLYFDGIENFYRVALPTGFPAANAADALIIGSKASAGTDGFIGYISHVAFYRTALSSDRIRAHYLAGTGNSNVIHLDYLTNAPYIESLSDNIDVTGTHVSDQAPLLSESMTISDTQSNMIPVWVLLSESFDVGFSGGPMSSFDMAFNEDIDATGSVSGTPQLSEMVTEELTVASFMTFAQSLQNAFNEGLQIRLGFDRLDTTYAGWTMNATSGAVTAYDHYGFNSFAKINGKYYGCKEDGLYELTGKTDDGAAINASVLLPNTDFGSANQKRIVHAYLGVLASGGMTLRVITNDGEENTYALDRENGVIKEARVDFGRGLRSRYWQLELQNVDGADFVLDEIELLLNTTTRRV
jgi:hypothetical protein